jgi:hypothetical protein
MVGLEGRAKLLCSLGTAICSDYFLANGCHRPGGLVDFVLSHSVDGKVPMAKLWECVLVGLQDIWPKTRTNINGN